MPQEHLGSIRAVTVISCVTLLPMRDLHSDESCQKVYLQATVMNFAGINIIAAPTTVHRGVIISSNYMSQVQNPHQLDNSYF